jgi:hypothetical protein
MALTAGHTIMISLMFLMATGWTINYNYRPELELVLPIFAVVGLVETLVALVGCLEISSMRQLHARDSTSGIILSGLQSLVLLGFVMVTLFFRNSIKGKSRAFYKLFVAMGSAYMAYPMLLHWGCGFLAEESQASFFQLGQELAETAMLATWGYLCLNKDSLYSKASFNQSSVFLPDDPKFY